MRIKMLALLLAAFSLPLHAADAPAKIKLCVPCHGIDGISTNSDAYPDIYGKKTSEIARALRAFRSGKRKDMLMQTVATQLSDADINSIAKHYGSIR